MGVRFVPQATAQGMAGLNCVHPWLLPAAPHAPPLKVLDELALDSVAQMPAAAKVRSLLGHSRLERGAGHGDVGCGHARSGSFQQSICVHCYCCYCFCCSALA